MEQKVIYPKIRLKMEMMTPEKAKNLLTRNIFNRKINRKNVNVYKKAIIEGNYIATGDCISLDIYGNLLNGQHRLTAIAEAGIPVEVDMKYGCPPEVRYIQNSGRAVTLTDKGEMFLKNLGIHPKMYSAISRTMDFFENKGSFSKEKLNYNPEQIMAFAKNEKNLDILKKVSKHAAKKRNIFGNASFALAKEVIFNLIDGDKAEVFFESIYEHDFMKGEPAYALWKWLDARKNGNTNSRWASRGEEELNIALNIAWNAFVKGESLYKIVINSKDEIRKIEALDENNNLANYLETK